jgi:hypothetical protein
MIDYYGSEANLKYMSCSQVKQFIGVPGIHKCEAKAVAELRGEYQRPESDALTFGSYIDVQLTGTQEEQTQFVEDHPDMFSSRGPTKGQLKSTYQRANDMIARVRKDADDGGVFLKYLDGDHQAVFTGEIGGLPCKAKFDVYDGRRIVDLKTVKDMAPVYKPGEGRMTFADAWNWPLQMAIYQALEGHRLPCYLAVITKEDPPNIEVVEIPQDKLDAEMDFLLEKLPYFDAIKQGIVEPERCENCAYCRMTKKLDRPRLLDEFEDFGGTEHE